jgi:acyl-CoA synthetase (AMP-forming)/AMP-acid ligase II
MHAFKVRTGPDGHEDIATSIDPQRRPTTLLELLRQLAHRHPERLALADPIGRLDFRQVLQQAQAFGELLRDAGVGASDRVAVLGASAAGLARIYLGVASHATCVTLDPASGCQEVIDLLLRTGVHTLVIDDGVDERFGAMAVELGVQVLQTRQGVPTGHRIGEAPGSPRSPHDEPGADDFQMISCSSGTTGRPKLVPRTHAVTIGRAFDLVDPSFTTCAICCLPLHHAAGLGVFLRTLALGGTFVTLGRFEAVEFAEWVQEMSPMVLNASPIILSEILSRLQARPDWLGDWAPSLVTSATAKLPERVLSALQERWGARFLIVYGSTEASLTAQIIGRGEGRIGSVGLPRMNEIRIVDPSGEPLAPGEVGAIQVRGPNVFSGYLDDPALTASVLVDGWFRPGDMGYLDEDGYLYLTGRQSTVINRGGAKVSAAELEAWLMERDGVRQAAVVGMPHATLGEDVVAAVVAHEGLALDVDQLRQAMAEVFPGYKVPSRMLLLESLPMTSTGKVRREALQPWIERCAVPPPRAAQTAPERAAVQAIARLLECESVGLDDNFFSLGGHSLLAARLMASVAEETGLPLTAAQFMREPTAAGLARLMQSTPGAHFHPAIERWRETGTEAPLFCLPGFDGHAHFVRGLLPFLSPVMPVFGVSTPEIDPLDPTPIDRLAEFCIARIREVQPCGPYRLTGFSFGGVVAHAVACGLQAQGEQVASLIILDASSGLSQFASPPRTAADRLHSSVSRHCPSVFDGRVVLLRSWSFALRTLQMPGLGWEHLAREGVTVLDVPTTHFGLMVPQNIPSWASFVDEALRGEVCAPSAADSQGKPAFIAYRALPASMLQARRWAIEGRHVRLAACLPALLQDPALPGWAMAWMRRVADGITEHLVAGGVLRRGIRALTRHRAAHRAALELPFDLLAEAARLPEALAALDHTPPPHVLPETLELARAVLEWRLGRTHQAQAALSRLEAQIGSRADLISALVRQCDGLGWHQVAASLLERWQIVDSTAARAELAFERTMIAFNAGRWADAARCGLESVSAVPTISAHQPLVIRALRRSGRTEEAARLHRESLERFSGRWGYREVLDAALAESPDGRAE